MESDRRNNSLSKGLFFKFKRYESFEMLYLLRRKVDLRKLSILCHHALNLRGKALYILNFVFRSLLKIIKVLIIVITSQTFECFWISVTQIRSNHVNRNWYSAGQEIISIEDYLLLQFNSTELLELHRKHAPSKQTDWISHFWAKQYFKGFTILQSGLMMRLFDLERVISWQNY